MCQSKIEVSSYNRPTTIDFLSWLFKEVYNEEIHNIEANQYYSTSTVLELSSTASANFNLTCLRRAYLCRYATCHTLLIKGCINRFLTEYSKAEELLKSWESDPFYCSLSLGPALDYIAFGFAIQDRSLSSWSDIRVRMVTRCTGWEKTTDILSGAMNALECMPFLKLESSTVLAGSVFEPWTSGAKKCLEKSNLIFMFKSLDLEEKNKAVNTVYLLELVNILKHGTTILFIDTSYSSSIMQDVLAKCPGTYLYGPISVSCNNKESSEQMETDSREMPVQYAVADFFVWQKNDNSPELKQLNKSSENKLNSLKICGNPSKSELKQLNKSSENKLNSLKICGNSSKSELKQLNKSSENKLNSLKICGNSSKSELKQPYKSSENKLNSLIICDNSSKAELKQPNKSSKNKLNSIIICGNSSKSELKQPYKSSENKLNSLKMCSNSSKSELKQPYKSSANKLNSLKMCGNSSKSELKQPYKSSENKLNSLKMCGNSSKSELKQPYKSSENKLNSLKMCGYSSKSELKQPYKSSENKLNSLKMCGNSSKSKLKQLNKLSKNELNSLKMCRKSSQSEFKHLNKSSENKLNSLKICRKSSQSELKQLNKLSKNKLNSLKICGKSSLSELKHLNKSSENKLNSPKICGNSSKSELHDKSQAQVNLRETAAISFDDSLSDVSSSSSLSPPTLNWRVKQDNPSNRETDEIKRKTYSLIERMDKLGCVPKLNTEKLELAKWHPSPYEPPGERNGLLKELATIHRLNVELDALLASNKPLVLKKPLLERRSTSAVEEARRRLETFNQKQRCRRAAEKRAEIEEERRQRHQRWKQIREQAQGSTSCPHHVPLFAHGRTLQTKIN